jgi:hypothetical protein
VDHMLAQHGYVPGRPPRGHWRRPQYLSKSPPVCQMTMRSAGIVFRPVAPKKGAGLRAPKKESGIVTPKEAVPPLHRRRGQTGWRSTCAYKPAAGTRRPGRHAEARQGTGIVRGRRADPAPPANIWGGGDALTSTTFHSSYKLQCCSITRFKKKKRSIFSYELARFAVRA